MSTGGDWNEKWASLSLSRRILIYWRSEEELRNAMEGKAELDHGRVIGLANSFVVHNCKFLSKQKSMPEGLRTSYFFEIVTPYRSAAAHCCVIFHWPSLLFDSISMRTHCFSTRSRFAKLCVCFFCVVWSGVIQCVLSLRTRTSIGWPPFSASVFPSESA